MKDKSLPGGPLILIAIVAIPLIWLFATQDRTSESVAPITAPAPAVAAQAAGTQVIGVWYDSLDSADYADSTLTIESEAGKLYLNRRNGDGSGGRFALTQEGNTYIKVGDNFGARYIVTPAGLEIHDSQGYIRTAKPSNRHSRNKSARAMRALF